MHNLAPIDENDDIPTKGTTVAKGGDSMSGNLTVDVPTGAAVVSVKGNDEYAEFRVDAPDSKSSALILRHNNYNKWKLQASATNHDFAIGRYDAAGVYQNTPFKILSATGEVVPMGALGDVTPASGWVDATSGSSGMFVTRLGPIIVVDAIVMRTSNLAVTAGTGVTIGTIPTGFRPAHTVNTPGIYISVANTSGADCRIRYDTNGAVVFVPHVSTTINTNHWVTMTASYRGE